MLAARRVFHHSALLCHVIREVDLWPFFTLLVVVVEVPPLEEEKRGTCGERQTGNCRGTRRARVSRGEGRMKNGKQITPHFSLFTNYGICFNAQTMRSAVPASPHTPESINRL